MMHISMIFDLDACICDAGFFSVGRTNGRTSRFQELEEDIVGMFNMMTAYHNYLITNLVVIQSLLHHTFNTVDISLRHYSSSSWPKKNQYKVSATSSQIWQFKHHQYHSELQNVKSVSGGKCSKRPLPLLLEMPTLTRCQYFSHFLHGYIYKICTSHINFIAIVIMVITKICIW